MALLDGEDAGFVRRAAERGVDAVAGQHSEEALQSVLRSHSRARSRTVLGTARSVLDGHTLLPDRPDG